MEHYIPGTVMPYTDVQGGMFSLFRPMIEATDGLSLGQVCAVTGLEGATVQNWIKRGFVDHPVKKKYYERQFARILIISALRDSMQIDKIASILAQVNGDVYNTDDDIISEGRLYDYLCETVRKTDIGLLSEETALKIIDEVVSDYSGPSENSKHRLRLALLVMLFAYTSGRLKREADIYLSQLRDGSIN